MILEESRKHFMKAAAFVLAFQLLLVGSVFSQPAEPQAGQEPPAEVRTRSRIDPEKVRTESMTLRIIAKNQDNTILTRHFRFMVTADTKIVGTDGTLLSLEQLKLPCSATIHYEPGKLDNRTAWQIIVRKQAKNASAAWSPPPPR